MNGTWSGRRTLLVIAASTVLGFLFWLFCLFLLWLVLDALGLNVDYWNMTQALSSAITVAALIGAGVIAYRELSEASSGRHVHVADSLFSELNSPENVEARRWIYRNLPKEPAEEGFRSLPPEGRAHVKRTLNSLDRVAFLTQAGWIPIETIMPWMNPMIVKSWEKLCLWVEKESQRRGEPDYYEHARQLGEDCIAWRKHHLSYTETEYLEEAQQGSDANTKPAERGACPGAGDPAAERTPGRYAKETPMTIPNHHEPLVTILEETDDYAFESQFRVRRATLQHRRFDGTLSEPIARISFERGDSVGVLLYDPGEDTVVLIRQFRYPVFTTLAPGERDGEGARQAWTLELVAGIVDRGRTVRTAARKELLEEPGYRVTGDLEPIATIYPSPGASSERIHLFLGEVDSGSRVGKGGGVRSEGEDIQTVVVPLDEAMEMVAGGGIQDAKTIVALQHLVLHKLEEVVERDS